MSMETILETIPHRPPFLFIDEIVEVSEHGAIAKRRIRPDEPQFEGHYPGNPIMPGVLLCEACFQAAAVYIGKQHLSGKTGSEGVPVLGRVNQARFRQIVVPGDELTIEVKLNEVASKFFMMSGTIKNQDGKLCLRVDFILTESEG